MTHWSEHEADREAAESERPELELESVDRIAEQTGLSPAQVRVVLARRAKSASGRPGEGGVPQSTERTEGGLGAVGRSEAAFTSKGRRS